MAKVHDVVTPQLQEFIQKQHLFFVASAPLSGDGHVNMSPKGYDCFRILSDIQVAYIDGTGSGNETSAHLMENGRVTIMFCAFEGAPNILRLYGQGRVVLPTDVEWETLRPRFNEITAARQIVVIDVHRVQTSCGYGVPFMDYVGDRDTAVKWSENKGEQGLIDYRREKNSASIDALPTHIGQCFSAEENA